MSRQLEAVRFPTTEGVVEIAPDHPDEEIGVLILPEAGIELEEAGLVLEIEGQVLTKLEASRSHDERAACFTVKPYSAEQYYDEQTDRTGIEIELVRRVIRDSPLAPQVEAMLKKTCPKKGNDASPEEQIDGLKEPLTTAILAPFATEPLLDERFGSYLPRELTDEDRQYLLDILAKGLAATEHPSLPIDSPSEFARDVGRVRDGLKVVYSEIELKYGGRDGQERSVQLKSHILGGNEVNAELIGKAKQEFMAATPDLIACGFVPDSVSLAIREALSKQGISCQVLGRNFGLYRELEQPDDRNPDGLFLTAMAMRENIARHIKSLADKEGSEAQISSAGSYQKALDDFIGKIDQASGEPVKRANRTILSEYSGKGNPAALKVKLPIAEAAWPGSVSSHYQQTIQGRQAWYTIPPLLEEENIDDLLRTGLARIQRKVIGHLLATDQIKIPEEKVPLAWDNFCQRVGISNPPAAFSNGEVPVAEFFHQLLELQEKIGIAGDLANWKNTVCGYAGPLLYQLEGYPEYMDLLRGNQGLDKKAGTDVVTLDLIDQLRDKVRRDGHELITDLPEKETIVPLPNPETAYKELASAFIGAPAEQSLVLIDFFLDIVASLDRCGLSELDPLGKGSPRKDVLLLTGTTGTGKTTDVKYLCDWFGKRVLERWGIEMIIKEVDASRLRPDGIEGIHLNDTFVELIQEIQARDGCSLEEARNRLDRNVKIVALDEAEHLIATRRETKDDLAAEARTQVLKLCDPMATGTYVIRMPPDQMGERKMLGLDPSRIFPIFMAAFSSTQYKEALKRVNSQREGVRSSNGPLTVTSERDLVAIGADDTAFLARLKIIPRPGVTREKLKDVLETAGPRNPFLIIQNELTMILKSRGYTVTDFEVEQGVVDLIVTAAEKNLASKGYRTLYPIMDQFKKYLRRPDTFPRKLIPVGKSGGFKLTKDFVKRALESS